MLGIGGTNSRQHEELTIPPHSVLDRLRIHSIEKPDLMAVPHRSTVLICSSVLLHDIAASRHTAVVLF